jgi:hypothetical protein
LAFLAALLGLAVGAVTASLIGTVKLMLTPGIQYSSYQAFLRAPPMVFLEGLLWTIIGGAMFVLPPGFLLLTGYAMTFGPERREPGGTGKFVFGFSAVLFALVFFFGFRSRPLDGLLLAVPVLVGVWTSLRFLNRRLGSPSAA